MSTTIITPEPKKPSLVKRYLPYIAVAMIALVLGIAMGAAGKGDDAEAAPAPTVTVTETVEVESEVDESCYTAAMDLWGMVESMNSDIQIPYGEVVTILHEQLTGVYEYGQIAFEVDEINRATGIISDIGVDAEALTAQLESGTGDAYVACSLAGE